MELLKLVALDPEDLAIMSAHLQDAVLTAGDLTYIPERRRFALVARRFDWECGAGEGPRRRLTGFHFDRVLRCRTRGIDRQNPGTELHLLAITFDETEPPSGRATLLFENGAAVQLDLECVESQMRDLGPCWAEEARLTASADAD